MRDETLLEKFYYYAISESELYKQVPVSPRLQLAREKIDVLTDMSKKDIYDELNDAIWDLEGANELHGFMVGFKAAIQFMTECKQEVRIEKTQSLDMAVMTRAV